MINRVMEPAAATPSPTSCTKTAASHRRMILPRMPTSPPTTYAEADADFEGFWAKQAEAAELGHRSRPRRWTGATRRSRSGTPTARSTPPTTACDRHVEAGNGDRVAFYFEGEPGDTREITYAAADHRGQAGGQRADRARREGRRPGRDLPADDPRGGGRHAGLRPDRRPAHGGLRRLLRRRAVHPDPGLRGRGRDHRRRRLPPGCPLGAQAGRRRGTERVPRRPARAGHPADRAGRPR